MVSSRANIRDIAAPRTFYVGNMKGVGRIYQQTFIDTYSKVAFAKLYDRKTPIAAAEICAAVLRRPWHCPQPGVDRPGTEYCGKSGAS